MIKDKYLIVPNKHGTQNARKKRETSINKQKREKKNNNYIEQN